MATTLSLAALYAPIQPELRAVRERVLEQWTNAFRLVYGPAAEPPKMGGKLMRPALTLLSASALGTRDLSRYIDMAAAMELLHLAALAHDDVVDESKLRRGQTSLNARWTNHIAVLGGDFLVARALSVLTVYDSCAVIASALESIHEMAEGELINFGRGQTSELLEEDCIRLAEKKTASLFAVSCATPALLINPADKNSLHAFGMAMGTAFQLVDDALDLDQDEDTLGKPSCADVSEGKMTLPIIYMREALCAEDVERFDALFGNELSDDDQEWIACAARATGAIQRVHDLARTYVERAHQCVEALPAGQYTEAMRGIAEFVLLRDH